MVAIIFNLVRILAQSAGHKPVRKILPVGHGEKA